SIERLAESLRTRGQLQPVRVRWDEPSARYILLMGERRWRAAVLACMTTLMCVVHDGELSPPERLALQLIENALREDLNPVEQAATAGLTGAEVAATVKARKLGKVRADPGGKIEFRFDDGGRVVVTLPAGTAGGAAVLEMLRRAAREQRAALRAAVPGADGAG